MEHEISIAVKKNLKSHGAISSHALFENFLQTFLRYNLSLTLEFDHYFKIPLQINGFKVLKIFILYYGWLTFSEQRTLGSQSLCVN